MSGRALTGAAAAWTVLIVIAAAAGEWLVMLGLCLVPPAAGLTIAAIVNVRGWLRPAPSTAGERQADDTIEMQLPKPGPRPPRARPPQPTDHSRVPTPDLAAFAELMRNAGAGDLEGRTAGDDQPGGPL